MIKNLFLTASHVLSSDSRLKIIPDLTASVITWE